MKPLNSGGSCRRAWLALLIALACTACGGGGTSAGGDAGRSSKESNASSRPGRVVPSLPPLEPVRPRSSIVAYGSPTGLTGSTGNLYWTSTADDEFDPNVSTVWRASKDSVPGAEIALYREYGDDRFFEGIVFANPGTWYGYFIANYQTSAGMLAQIKRVPLVGGTAVVMATSPASGARDLLTDGTTLFWVDGGGVRSMPVVGGEVSTLYADAFISRIALDENYVYFGQDYLVMRVPKSGGTPQTVASTNGRVSALYVEGGGSQQAFWGDQDGGVYGVRTDHPDWPSATYQAPIPGREVKAIGNTVGLIWVDCAQPGNTDCCIRDFHDGVIVCCHVGITHLHANRFVPPSFFWGDAGSLRRTDR